MTVGTWFAIAVGGFLLLMLGGTIGMIAVGLRGRRMDDHPYCRHCGFDLFGKPTQSSVCSECGRDLNRRHAVRHGRREKRWLPLSIGVVCFVLLIASMTAGGIAARYVQDWNEYKPLWWLLGDAESANLKVREAARDTLLLKQAKDQWSETQRRELINFALDRYADNSADWTNFWGQRFYRELSRDRLPYDQWRRYVRMFLPERVTLQARAKVERDKPLPFELQSHGRPADGHMAGMELRGRVSDRTVWIDNIELKLTGGPWRMDVHDGAISVPRIGLDLSPVLARLADGPHTLRIRQRFVAFGGPGFDFEPAGKTRWKECGERTEDQTVTFELLPTGTTGLRPRQDESVRAALEKFCVTNVLRLYRDHPIVSPLERLSGGRLDLDFQGPVPSPTALAVSLTPAVRYQGREWLLRDFFWRPGEEIPRFSLTGLAGNLPKDAARVDVILRPSPKALEQTLDLFDYWDGEIVLKNLPVFEDGVHRDPELRRLVEEHRAAREMARNQSTTQRAATQSATQNVTK